MIACLDDEDMDLSAKLKKLKEILTTEEKMLGDGKSKSAADDDEGGAAEESRRLETQTLREIARAGITLTPLVERAIAGCRTKAEATELVESLRGEQRPARPGARSAPPTRDQATANQLRESEQRRTEDTPEARQARVREARRAR